MGSMDTARRVGALRNQIEEANAGGPADFEGWKRRTQATLRTTMGATHPTVEAFNAVSYGLMVATSDTPQSAWDRAQERGVRRGISILEGAIHEIELSEPVEPELRIGGLHPWIAGAVSGLWDHGHHRQAVDEAAHAIEVRLKALIGSHQTATPLVTDAFNPDPPKVGSKRLRFVGYQEGTPEWSNAHEGAMHYARGCMMRIRNLAEHEDAELSEQEALEALAALSLLARWIAGAIVVEG